MVNEHRISSLVQKDQYDRLEVCRPYNRSCSERGFPMLRVSPQSYLGTKRTLPSTPFQAGHCASTPASLSAPTSPIRLRLRSKTGRACCPDTHASGAYKEPGKSAVELSWFLVHIRAVRYFVTADTHPYFRTRMFAVGQLLSFCFQARILSP